MVITEALLGLGQGWGVGEGTGPWPPPSRGAPGLRGSPETQEHPPELELGKESQATQGQFYAFSSKIAIVGENSLRLWNHKFFKVSWLHF